MKTLHPSNRLLSVLLSVAICTLLLFVAAVSAQAAAILVPNGDFETLYKPGTGGTVYAPPGSYSGYAAFTGNEIVDMDLGFASVTWSDFTTSGTGQPDHTAEVPGWNTGGGGYVFLQNNYLAINGEGTLRSSNGLGTISAGLDYTLSVDAFFAGGGTGPGINNSLYLAIEADGVDVLPAMIAVTGTNATYSVTLTADQLALYVGQTLQVRVGATGTGGTGDGQLHLDNVTLGAVPEPGTLAMVAIGCALLPVLRRRRLRGSKKSTL